MNKLLKIVIGLIVLAVAYYLLSPFWRNVTLDEGLPGVATESSSESESAPVVVKDNMESMSAETKVSFEAQTMEMKDKMMEKNEVMPSNEPVLVSKSDMVARAHEVEGSALIIQSSGETYLRFENLKTINGPDLRIYLSSDLSVEDAIDLGPIRATEGNVNYVLPAGVDLNKYKNAMIWCRAFGVLFSYAAL